MPDDFPARFARATVALQAGYDPEPENGLPVKSDAWCRALGWCDQIGEEVMANSTQVGKGTRILPNSHPKTAENPNKLAIVR